MNETDLFNKDSMFWREVNFSSPNTTAELVLIEPVMIAGKMVETIVCSLFPFEAHVVEYDIENNGGSFTKNEVKAWPFVLMSDLAFYQDEENSEAEREAKVQSIEHAKVQAITLKDQAGNVVLTKEKVQ